MIKEITNWKLKIGNYNRGMTYVELIVVLSIFSIMTSVVLFNYGAFQAKVDIKNLASDIALKIVEAQKSALSGKLSTQVFISKPAYGLYFNTSPSTSFIYFADFNNNKIYDETPLDTILITKNNSISRIDSYLNSFPTQILTPMSIIFKRPDSSAVFSYADGVPLIGSDYIQITISSSGSVTAVVKIYPSGRIQIN